MNHRAALTLWALLLGGQAHADDAPEISRSLGPRGGIVVLWPRVSPTGAVDSGAAGRTQAALAALARTLGVSVDVRPEPERVCPRGTGCRAVAVGAVLTAHGSGCVALATVSLPGTTPATLLPWVGQMQLRQTTAPFREPPENQLVVTDYADCTTLDQALTQGTASLLAAMRTALAGG